MTTALRLITMTATTTCPRIISETVKAAHGPKEERGRHLRKAIAHTSDLLNKLQAVAEDLERADKLDEAHAS